ncbi:RtcB family protein [Micromonospora sagamiensis]|uniref:3'-phosphate/5'-hydroxy nucleic acid ligase n=1 Tax=Micromonospora sagamiensis TaxID=47875 RepID=A0A562WGF1_9ACTN|nr:RtcB family protein [Micromonospora sagamiensis]TWJ29252.1 tRNA-splicing ligase RtcB [Micromonospora sagamiensis]BCL17722.1 RNA-splicing ligase RtcB [Micromonospora sagamiensis]
MSFTPLHGTRAPVRVWTDPYAIEEQALRQLRNIGALPWVQGVAVMPDVHFGKGATVGSVIAMRQAVSPAAVGVDIGCGMSAVRTSLTAADLPDDLAPLRGAIEAAIPVGFAKHDRMVDPRRVRGLEQGGWDRFWRGFDDLDRRVHQLKDRAQHQMGTLGGGNHFIEVCLEQGGADDGRVWLMLHSGSRNIGKELAERHMAVARRLPHNADLPDRDLAVFLAGTPEMDAYRRDLWWAQEYARRNRAVMLALLCDVVRGQLPQVRYDEPISCHHNYVAEETYDGVEVLVTRKGAIRAGVGDLGIIPGSMGTGSYIVRGRGNPDAYCSASHGAGRRMSRGQAKRTFTTEDLAAQTAGVECRKDPGVVDEIPGAYKDIVEVMAKQEDLVEVVAHLKQVVCVKG